MGFLHIDRSLKMPKFALLKTRVVILFFSLLPSWRHMVVSNQAKWFFVPWPRYVGSGWSGQPSLWWYSRSKVKLGSQPVGQSGYAAWLSSWLRQPQEHWAGSPWQGSARVSPSLTPWARALSQITGCVARHGQGCEGSEQSGLAASGSHGWGPALAEASPQPCPGASPQGHQRERQPSAEPPSRCGAVAPKGLLSMLLLS